jgi:hypothetical protein
MPLLRRTTTDLFICDQCSTRKRLASAKRHWCDTCKINGAPVELRLAKDKRPKFPVAA